MRLHFEKNVRQCLWNDCGYHFKGKSCGIYSLHVQEHISNNRLHQCLWEGCGHIESTPQDLSKHISIEHDVPNEWTIHTKMHYCYEHAMWCHSSLKWDAHLQQSHVHQLTGFCGIIRHHGLVAVAAHCLFCLGNKDAPLETRFMQFHDVFTLHKHMKNHLAADSPTQCPHPLCDEAIGSEAAFWEHANTVHGTPPFGTPRGMLKRKASNIDDGIEEGRRIRLE